MLVKHYSPRARLMLYDGEHARVISKMCEDARRLQSEGKRAGVLAIGGDALRLAPHATVMQLLGDEHDLEGIAASLFAAMRSLDAAGVDVILARAPVREGLGAAIYDRLLRAAEGQVIRVEH
jgi:L-threonylcarbamoyladenylate synthase